MMTGLGRPHSLVIHAPVALSPLQLHAEGSQTPLPPGRRGPVRRGDEAADAATPPPPPPPTTTRAQGHARRPAALPHWWLFGEASPAFLDRVLQDLVLGRQSTGAGGAELLSHALGILRTCAGCPELLGDVLQPRLWPICLQAFQATPAPFPATATRPHLITQVRTNPKEQKEEEEAAAWTMTNRVAVFDLLHLGLQAASPAPPSWPSSAPPTP
jgi:hypothetical protein